jgi:hypothetical protein
MAGGKNFFSDHGRTVVNGGASKTFFSDHGRTVANGAGREPSRSNSYLSSSASRAQHHPNSHHTSHRSSRPSNDDFYQGPTTDYRSSDSRAMMDRTMKANGARVRVTNPTEQRSRDLRGLSMDELNWEFMRLSGRGVTTGPSIYDSVVRQLSYRPAEASSRQTGYTNTYGSFGTYAFDDLATEMERRRSSRR